MSGVLVEALRSRMQRPAFAPLAALASLWLLMLCLDPGYFAMSIENGRLFGGAIDILNRAAPVALLAIGMSLVIATGGICRSINAGTKTLLTANEAYVIPSCSEPSWPSKARWIRTRSSVFRRRSRNCRP